ncbi:MAG: hypothetical protein U0U66_10000 [Cytophagaceae bacterium]
MNYPNPYSILIIGNNVEIVEVLLRLINKSKEYSASAVIYHQKDFNLSETNVDLILLSSGLSLEEEQEIKEQLFMKNPNIKIIQHYGGGSGLLYTELKQALSD